MAAESLPQAGGHRKSARVLLFGAMLMTMISGCETTYLELRGECVMQRWQLFGQTMRSRTLCDLPPPDATETQVRDREAMDVNPFPGLLDFNNPADSTDPNLLEKELGYPQAGEDE